MATLPPASFSIENILIMESRFSRAVNISDAPAEQELKIDNKPGKAATGEITAELSLTLTGRQEGAEIFQAWVKAVGVFRRAEESELEEDFFLRVNAPAIIFPFVREHIATLALKAGLGAVLLPPVNFVQRSAADDQEVSAPDSE